jgi:hypothetical protein
VDVNKTTAQSSPHAPTGRRYPPWAIGCAIAIALALTGLLVLLVLGRQQAARVESAIEATMPDYCRGTEERIQAYPEAGPLTSIGTFVPFPARSWHVHCWTSVTCQPLITVDVRRCEAHVVTAFSGTYTETLSPCP